MIPRNVNLAGYISTLALAGRIAEAVAKTPEPQQTNVADPAPEPAPPKSRQVRRAEARREAKSRTAYNKRMGFE